MTDISAYLRREPKSMQALIDKHYAAALAARLSEDAPSRKFAGPVARAALDLLEPGEAARCLYGGVTLDLPEGAQPVEYAGGLWLLGAGERIVLFAAGEQPKVVWRGDASVHAEQCRNLLLTSCRLTGGTWLVEGASPLAIRIPTGLVSTFATFFRPLFAMLEPFTRVHQSAAEVAAD